jgi:hypothetical protein
VHQHAQIVDGSGEGGTEALLAPDAVEVDALRGFVREPGDGVGDDVRVVAAELVRGDDLLRGAEQDGECRAGKRRCVTSTPDRPGC